MNRLQLIKIHLYLSGISLVFMGLMSLTGSLHLFLGDEAESVVEVKSLNLTERLDKDQLTQLFSDELKRIDPEYSYGYIKGSANSLTSRPTNRTYYTIKATSDTAIISKHEPSLRKMFMEFHMGHGPRVSRNIMGVLGLIVIGAVLSGFWLGFSSRPLRKTTFFTLGSGALIYFLFFFL
ncbi:MAG: PepSY domain-containing protein [Bdellovibrionales bacterium]|nr:PepSY domain-containing protein [Bdellovibrionales bacterium]